MKTLGYFWVELRAMPVPRVITPLSTGIDMGSFPEIGFFPRSALAAAS
jgi:hypothetical protein